MKSTGLSARRVGLARRFGKSRREEARWEYMRVCVRVMAEVGMADENDCGCEFQCVKKEGETVAVHGRCLQQNIGLVLREQSIAISGL